MSRIPAALCSPGSINSAACSSARRRTVTFTFCRSNASKPTSTPQHAPCAAGGRRGPLQQLRGGQANKQATSRSRFECAAAAASGDPAGSSPPAALAPGVPWKQLALIFTVLLTGVANRVLYKMTLVPMRDYTFFLAQLQNVGYLLAYLPVLLFRYRSGAVTSQMLAVDKRPFVLIGACEAAAQLLFMIGAAQVPGMLLPVVNQTYLVWNLTFASLILGTRYAPSQVAGALLVMFGVMVAAVPPSVLRSMGLGLVLGSGPAGAPAAAATSIAVEPVYVGICIACFAFPAIASCIKELIFRSAQQRLGRPLDIFVVNSFGSLAQALFVVLLLPITTALNGLPLSQLPQYLAEGLRALLAAGPGGGQAVSASLSPCCSPGAGGAALPVLPLALSYVATNLAFNVSILTLLRSVGTVATTLVASCLVPLTIAAFTLPLPYLPPATTMPPNFGPGVALLMGGLLLYNINSWRGALAAKGS